MATYGIMNVHDHDLFWSNEFGWVERDQADTWLEWESGVYDPPVEGVWVILSP